jgi:hypothetical protein
MKTRLPLASTASVPCHFSIVISGNFCRSKRSAARKVPSGPVSRRLVCTEAGTVAQLCFGHLQVVQLGCGGGAGPRGGGAAATASSTRVGSASMVV